MNQKCCTTCPYVDVNKMSDERYCSAIVKNLMREIYMLKRKKVNKRT